MMRRLVTVTACTAMTMAAAAQTTRTWDGGAQDGGKWRSDANWSDDTRPGPGDTAVIPTCLECTHVVTIETQDAECKILQIAAGNTLIIEGQKLTLGQDSTRTTSTLTGTALIQFKKDGDDKAELALRDWVEFEGGGLLQALQNQNDPTFATISRASGGGGISVSDGVRVLGQFHLLVSIEHDSYLGSADAFGVHGTEIMRFGPTAAALSPEMAISTSTPANARSVLRFNGGNDESPGTGEFYFVTFDDAAPNWHVRKFGLIIVDSAPGSSYYVNAPFNVRVDDSGTFFCKHDFSCTGELRARGDTAGFGDGGARVKVSKTKTVDFHD